MRHQDIAVGDTLLLKKERADAYDLLAREVEVKGIVPNKGYAVPWIQGEYPEKFGYTGYGVFKPSDFSKKVATTVGQ